MTAQLSMTLRTFAAEEPDDWSSLVTTARAADAAGLDRLVLSDHVVFGENLDAYGDPANGGTRGGKQPTGPDGSWLDPLATMAHLTAVTERVRFGTNILIAALRRPAVLAKTAATIDVLSNGRLDLGVGVGWQREEYEAAGLRFEGRGALLNETLEICQTLWGEQRASFTGDTASFDGIHQMPKPRQVPRGVPGVPIWVSGTINTRSMDRLARFGSGWIPWGDDAADLVGAIPRMRDALAQRGRADADIAAIGVVGNLRGVKKEDGTLDVPATMAAVGPLQDAGVTDFRMALNPPADLDEATHFLAAIVGAFRARKRLIDVDYVRIWADDAGESHLDEVTLARTVAPGEPGVAELWLSESFLADRVQFVTVKDEARSPDWHCAPRRQFVVFLDGWVRVTTSVDGTYEFPAGTTLLVEDTEGRGHLTEHEPGDRAVILIPLEG